MAVYRAGPGAVILLSILLVLSSGFSAACGVLLQPVLTALAAALFAFLFMVTFSPAYVLLLIPAYGLSLLLTGSFFTAFSSFMFLPAGAVLALCMLKRLNKTPTVIRVTVTLGITMIVFFLISFVAEFGTLSKEAFSQYFGSLSDAMQASLEEGAAAAAESLAGTQVDNSYLQAALSPSVIRDVLNSIKLSVPAYLVIFFEIFGYVAVSLFGILTRIFRCRKLLPANYRLTVSMSCAVVFMISYLVFFFTPSDTVTVIGAASENLTLILSPALALEGLCALKRKAADPLRRTGFILSLIVLVILFFVSPAICYFFLVLDGIGEVFTEHRLRSA